MDMLFSGLPEQVADEEDLARFLTSSNQFNTKGVRHTVFLPEPKAQETSVFRHEGEPREALWAIGNEHASQGRTIHGAAILKAGEIRVVRLEVIADEPPPRHAAIRNWPWIGDDPDLLKAERMELAMALASKAQLLRK
jgi:hypothetical protein